MGVIAVGMLALMSVFVAGQRANTYGANLSAATNRARQMMELVRSNGLAFNTGAIPPGPNSGLNDGTKKVALDSSPPTQFSTLFKYADATDPTTGQESEGDSSQALAVSRFKRNIVTTRASNDSKSYLYNLLQMKVTVYWEERGTERSVTVTSLLKQGGT